MKNVIDTEAMKPIDNLYKKEVTTTMNDKVPERYKPLFTNEEWLQHQLVVLGSWIFFVLAGLNHVIIAMYKPWISPTP